MENENRKRNDSVFSRKIRAGRRRTYFFDVRTTRGSDYYLTITESKKRFDGNGYERHKLFIYKEDFNKFIEEMTAAVDHIKGLMPDFDFDAYSHKYDTPYDGNKADEGQPEDMHDDHQENEMDDSHDDGNDTMSDSAGGEDEDLKL